MKWRNTGWTEVVPRGPCGVPTHGITGAVHIQGKKEQQRKCIQGMRHLKTHKTLIWEKGVKYSVKVIAFYLCPYLFIDNPGLEAGIAT